MAGTDSLAPKVRRILAANPGLMTGAGTNTYLLGDREVVVLDPGPDDTNHLQSILAAGDQHIRWVVVTHTHRDHSPLAAELARRTGARTIGLPPPADGRQDEGFRPDHRPHDGEELILGDVALTAIHTPGHASNCVCYLLRDERLLFTGDHVLGAVTPVILPPDGDMAHYLSSLDKLQAYEFDCIAPGHGEILPDGKATLKRLHAHRMAREGKVLRRLSSFAGDGASLEHLTPAVYDDVAVERHAFARLTLEAHLIKLAREGRVSEHNGIWRVRGE
jgi:glyoxylase-like metal-dependent hydrolase (beta-lactamase superfamily II)